nr:hypothetical protein [uncultured Clostridium sp.]
MIFKFGQYQVDIDVDKTKSFYENAPLVSEGCSCSGCRNYEKAITVLPAEVTGFFSDLGVDMRKVSEVYVNCNNSDGTLFYGGFYHLCGTLLLGESAWVSIDPSISHWEEEQAFKITNDFHVSFQKECSLLEDDLPRPALQLEISANIPWVLHEENKYL